MKNKCRKCISWKRVGETLTGKCLNPDAVAWANEQGFLDFCPDINFGCHFWDDGGIKKLSVAYEESKKELTYAICSGCEKMFIDDIPMLGNLICPYCNYAIWRGEDTIEDAKKVIQKQKELRNKL